MIKLLIVDDEHIVRERFTNHIPWAEAGFIFLGAAANGEKALEHIEREEPHILLTDITMPVMDGIELAKRVRSRFPKIRIVFLTVYSEFVYTQQAIQLGIRNYLLKAGLSTVHLLEACSKLADEIKAEINEGKQEGNPTSITMGSQDWDIRKEMFKAWMNDFGSSHRVTWNRFTADHGWEQGSYSAIWMGWDLYSASTSLYNTSEETKSLQMDLCQRIERKVIQEHGLQSYVFPSQFCRCVVLLRAPLNMGSVDLHAHLFGQTREYASIIEEVTGAKSFAYVTPIVSSTDALLKSLKQTRQFHHLYFYKTFRVATYPDQLDCQKGSNLIQTEWISKAVKSFHNSDYEDIYGVVDHLTKLQEPPYESDYLLETAKRIMENGLATQRELLYFLLFQLERIETWDDYCSWWKDTIQLLAERRFIPERVQVRREIRQMRQLIHEQYHRDLNLMEAASSVHLNATYAGQLFKKETGMFFTEYLNQVRLRKAKELMEQTNMKIYEIALAVGIQDYRYFCKLFKNIMGVTPREFKGK